LRDGSLALGGHKSETILKVLIPAALPGIMGGFLLATSRAIGETMIVVLAAGGQANLTLNILDQMTTVTVQITELLIGDAEFDRANTLSVFGLGMVLFISTLLLNLAAIQIVRRYRQRYS
jgi:phosphate transport system permease protein